MAPAKGLAALREARERGGRLSQWKPQDSELYDEVTDDQYRSIVGTRLEADDFIEDDDHGGYVDHGLEDWDGAEDDEEDSEDEDAFEGEDEEFAKARKAKRAKAKARANAGKPLPKTAKPKAKSAFSDYARPAASSSTSTYRPAPNAMQEDDFMASLLSSVTSAANEPAHRTKRKSSPDIPSSEGFHPSSDSSFFSSSGTQRKRYGHEDDEEVWDAKRGVMGKKPRVSDVTVVPGGRSNDRDQENDSDFIMDVDDEDDHVIVKPEPIDEDEDEDEMEIRKVKPLSSAATKLNGAAPTRRRGVNSSSVKHVVKPQPAHVDVKAEPDLDLDIKMVKPSPSIPRTARQAPPGSAHWSSVQESLLPQSSPKVSELDEVRAPVGSTKSENVLEEDGSLRMYWLDHLEQDGVVLLIGKVLDRQTGKYVSCCLSINGIERNLFVKPRAKRFIRGQETDEDVSRTDVFSEFDQIRRKAGIEEWAAKYVQRKYAFEDKGVEKGESEWFKVAYGFDQPEIPMDTTGQTFSHVFGTNTTPFELLVIKRKIMGPCWLKIDGATLSTKSASWCKIEFTVSDPKNVNPFSETDSAAPKETPPLTIMSISLRTIVNHRENKTELLCATTRTWEGYNIEDPTAPDQLRSSLSTIIRPIEKFPPGLESRGKSDRSPFQTVKAERALLNSLLATIQRHDPDVLVGHNFLGNTFEALLYRMKELKADHWSRIGRFRRKGFNISKAGSNVRLLAGRLVADLSSDAAKGMISSTTWSLTEMCGTHLKVQREDIDPEDTHSYFDHTLSSPDRLIKFIRLCEVDAFFQMAIAARVQMLPLTKQLTNLAGNSWNLTLNGGRAVRNEFILLHEFHRLKYVCPDKVFSKFKSKPAAHEDEDGAAAEDVVTSKATRGKAKYAGGLVFEPKRGLWDTYILVMDFNSLYPSIIQEYNIDFTTVEREEDEDAEEEKIPDVPASDVAQGVLPRIIATLVNRRRQVKGLMKDKSATPAQLLQYDIRQQALKLTANSMYGCLGFAGSRFSSRPLAALTTFKGREILTHTRELAESLQLDVVYGDTDSVFVNSNVTTYPEAQKIANDFKKLVNERYKLLEIDLDAVFERILLLNKKKYAAVKIDESGEKTTEVKGLDMKRREFSKVSKDASSAVLKEVLSGESTEIVVERIHELLTNLGEGVRNGAVPLEDFIIFKRLGKNPEDYPDKKSQPHVQVALRMKSKGAAVRAHDVIPYIMCLGEDGKGGKTAQAERAFHPDDLRRQGSELKIDYDFYLDTQILQPVLRLCETIEGTERARLAECLGLDPSRYASSGPGVTDEKQFFTFESQISDKERFKEAEPLKLRCMACEGMFEFQGLMEEATNIQPVGISCSACHAILHPASVSIQLENQIRQHISRYYLGWTVCDDDGCGFRTRMMGVYGRRCLGFGGREGCKGTVRLEYSDSKLYNQLLYFRSLFDGEKAISSMRGSARFDEVRALVLPNTALFGQLLGVADKYLDKNGRRFVDMKGLFGFMERIKL
ncbi:DNA polymerase alpha subunit A [Kwoniella heveanensis BCC8398]|uniref:DNA polymerase n=1 Tax=Kwoniella heveanensis BCC8398 TaxID=1296120 RepID=A0A1B9GSJ1_9TREE|nr:DNA polymerase alpha subunit A [Kwoniella heveanensis BCC8398]